MTHPTASPTSERTAAAIRRQFIDFFVERGHREVPSAPVFPKDDPTLLFTNAGMNQFKDVFLGSGSRDYVRAVDTQKCIRVSGKHNDLEEVGVDTYHHTFFEMLGNWSFGDYFKEDAILWAWELFTKVWGLDKDRLWVTVFAGDAEDGLDADEEAERIWLEKTDIDPTHVLRFGKKDNFWEMGETGPCGPCCEIHIDRGGEGAPDVGADPALGVNAGNERFIELWNLVFMQYQRMDDRSLGKLPACHVDTGMGFERIVSVLQGKSSNYDTDVFRPIFDAIEGASGKRYGDDERTDIAFRVVADHVRAVSAAFADGALPSNAGRGYVLRRLLRRASRYVRQDLGIEDPFLHRIVPAVSATLGEASGEIREREEHIRVLVRAEEEAFGKTLGRGLVHFGELAGAVEAAGNKVIPGTEAFDLYATFGFPRDLVDLMARERGLKVDEEGWERARARHQEASRSEGAFRQILSADETEGLPATRTTFHEEGEGSVRLQSRVLLWAEREGEEGRDVLVLEATPFYAESGGQVGDKGRISSADGSFEFRVHDTQKAGGVIVHIGSSQGRVEVGAEVLAEVDEALRAATRRHHTATHLLHRALREVLGDHVTQQGSYVGPDRLRFDLSHPRGITQEELEEIERRVNAAVIRDAAVRTTVEDLEAAKERGVMALFGEKYGDRVRVVDVGGWSTELCGGTHVGAAGEIGPFLIQSETAIQAGVRRIEAVAGELAVAEMQRLRRNLTGVARALKSSAGEVLSRVEDLQKRLKAARKAEEKTSAAGVDAAFDAARGALTEEDGVLVGALDVPLDGKGLRELASRLKGFAPDLAVVLVGTAGDKVPWIGLCQGAALEKGLDARQVPAFVRGHIGGGGGGKSELSQGQGVRSEGRAALLEALAAEPLSAFRG
ncbi:MAG TPA: alanine--tRNA ligase [Planctomycetes bacterium]|nr:alanine--tRNA ligase [Planctomycetota bacterium]